MADWFESTVLSGSLALSVPVAIIAGLVSFFSPCVLPLLPGYLSYATGLSGAEIASGEARRGRMLAGAVLFVLGFSVVFVLLGVSAGGVSDWLVVNRRLLDVILGVVAIVLGLAFIGLVPLLQREWRVHKVPAVGLAAAPLLGFLFGVGWVPCVSPTLGAIYTLALYDGSSARGGLLLAFYSLGLGLPFILAAVLWRRMLGAIAFVRRHQQWVTRIGGGMLVIVGLLLVTGWWAWAITWMQVRIGTGSVPV